jgi:hypothetical protein
MAREGYWSRQLCPIAMAAAERGRAMGLEGKELERYVRRERPWWLRSEGGHWGARVWSREVDLVVRGIMRPIVRAKRKPQPLKPAGEADQGMLF